MYSHFCLKLDDALLRVFIGLAIWYMSIVPCVISRSLVSIPSGEERGLLSRTAAGDRAQDLLVTFAF